MDKSSSIRGAIVIFVAISLALWLGVSIVTDQTETVLYVIVGSLFITCLLLGRKIWLLLIFFYALNVPLAKGFGTMELGQGLFVGFTSVIFLMRRQPLKIKFGEMEIWMLLIAACVVQVYLRNPVGLNIFGASSVGARPYFTVTLSFITAMMLGSVVVNPNEIKWSLRLAMIGSIIGVGLTALRMGGDTQAGYEANAQLDDGRNSSRVGGLATLGNNLARIIVSYVSPLRALLHPLWALLIIGALAAAAGSGFRNSVAGVGMLYIVGIAYRGGAFSVCFAAISCALGLGILAIVNVASPLPPNVQRALSPFPGTWEKRHVQGAEESTEWRIDMWKQALFTDYWIHNKILGDGLGFTRKELEMMEATLEGGRGLGSMHSGMSGQQEAMMLTGGYHSGPVQTVRIVGYVGLAVLLLAMIRVAVHGHRQIQRCRGTEWFPIALYVGIPAITLPFFFVFIFGEFGRDASAVFFSYAMISLLEKNLPLPAYVKARRVPYVLMQHRSPELNAPAHPRS